MWLPHLGQRLSTEREDGNAEDRFAVAVREHTDIRADRAGVRPIVRHLPRKLSEVLWLVTSVSFSLSP